MVDNDKHGETNHTHSVNRRTALRALGVGAATAVAATGTGIASSDGDRRASSSDEPGVSRRYAARLATAKVEQLRARAPFERFDPAGVETPTLFYSRRSGERDEYVPSVWVFPLTNGGDHVGHITIGAQTWLPPVVEYGTSRAPQLNGGAVTSAVDPDVSIGDRFLFQGPLSFGLEAADPTATDGTAFVDLETGVSLDTTAVPTVGPSTADAEGNEAAWRSLDDAGFASRVGDLSVTPLDSGSIPGVPNWTDYADPWSGCSPIAASMSIGYHENTSSWNRDVLIDELNDEMGTDSDGLTWPWNIPGGIESYDGDYNYSASNNYYGRPSAAKGGVNTNNPPLLSTMGDKEAGKEDVAAEPDNWDAPVGHTETIVGYTEESSIVGTDLYLETHNTWGGTRELLVGGYFDTYMITTIEP